MERALDAAPRHLVPTDAHRRSRTGSRPATCWRFATGIEGLDVTHTGLAYRDPAGVMRVLHAPLSGGVVQISRGTAARVRGGSAPRTGILVARPLRG